MLRISAPAAVIPRFPRVPRSNPSPPEVPEVPGLPDLGHRDSLLGMMKKMSMLLVLGLALVPAAHCQAPAQFGDKKANAETAAKLDAIMIPQLVFQDARLTDVIDFIVATSQVRDPKKGPEGEGEGVNIELIAGPVAVPKISITLRRVTLGDALSFISDIAGMELTLKNGMVQLVGKEAAEVRIAKRLDQLAKTLDLKGEQAAAFKQAADDIRNMARHLPNVAPPIGGPEDFFVPVPKNGSFGDFFDDPQPPKKPKK